jgi:small-conductance mechanosensitive channel
MQQKTSTTTEQFRQDYRKEFVQNYNFWNHIVIIHIAYLIVLFVCYQSLKSPVSITQVICTVPIAFLWLNFSEYMGHRFPMHRRNIAIQFGVEKVFIRHAKQHHHFFTDKNMTINNWNDAKAVLFPPFLLFFFLIVFVFPFGIVLGIVLNRNVALLFIMTAWTYFMNYEWLHLIYHSSQIPVIGSIRFLNFLKQHHMKHHDYKHMVHSNFNITYPIFDYLFGTVAKE